MALHAREDEIRDMVDRLAVYYDQDDVGYEVVEDQAKLDAIGASAIPVLLDITRRGTPAQKTAALEMLTNNGHGG